MRCAHRDAGATGIRVVARALWRYADARRLSGLHAAVADIGRTAGVGTADARARCLRVGDARTEARAQQQTSNQHLSQHRQTFPTHLRRKTPAGADGSLAGDQSR
jgi:hypothetical protein